MENTSTSTVSQAVDWLALEAKDFEKESAIFQAAFNAAMRLIEEAGLPQASIANAVIEEIAGDVPADYGSSYFDAVEALQAGEAEEAGKFTVIGYYYDSESESSGHFVNRVVSDPGETPLTPETAHGVVAEELESAVIIGVLSGHRMLDQIFSYTHDYTLDAATVLSLPDTFGDGSNGKVVEACAAETKIRKLVTGNRYDDCELSGDIIM